MFAAAPAARRPSWNTATIVDPNEKLSGSTAVSCWLSAFVPASSESRRDDRLAADDAVAEVGAHDVVARAAVDLVDAAEGGLDEVGAGARLDRVRRRGADDQLPVHGAGDRRCGRGCERGRARAGERGVARPAQVPATAPEYPQPA